MPASHNATLENSALCWSRDGQTPEFLAATRMASLANPIAKAILRHLGIGRPDCVLDVGCGSGEYCFRLGAQTSGVHFTGVDSDGCFVDFARRRAAGTVGYPFELPNQQNTYEFMCANGLHLPFETSSFDAVVSHTYLTAVPDWKQALAEMKRVCKPGGTVSSITSMTDGFYGTGSIWLLGYTMAREDADLVDRVTQARQRAFGTMPLTAGIPPREAPRAFALAGLSQIRCMPIGHYFCLSDAALEPDEYRRHVELLYAAERKELDRALFDSHAKDLLPASDWLRFSDLVEQRYETLLALEGSNGEWNWYGNSSLLVSGVK